MAFLMRLESLMDGTQTPFDGQYLVEYDPERDGVDDHGEPMDAHLVTTADPAKAKRFEDLIEFQHTWALVCQRRPVRYDGKPNRPLTSFMVSTVRINDDGEVTDAWPLGSR